MSAIDTLKELYADHVRAAGDAPVSIFASKDFFEAYRSELTTSDREAPNVGNDGPGGEESIPFKAATVVKVNVPGMKVSSVAVLSRGAA